MKAMVIRNYGGPEVFELSEIKRPKVKSGYVLVKVLASSVNPIEMKIRSGLVPVITPELPAVLNADFSGEIVEVGENTSPWKVGDQVFGCGGGVGELQGALAEYMLVDSKLLAPKPQHIDHATAALYPLVSITAWEAIREKGHVQRGDSVLIHGAAGGVGHIAVQLAKEQGAIVYGTVLNEAQAEVAKKAGADVVIRADLESAEEYTHKYTANKGFDIVFDPVGGHNLEKSFQAVKMNGIVCTTNARVTLDLAIMHGKAISLNAVFMLIPLIYDLNREKHGQITAEIARLITAGKLNIHADSRQFTFAEISKAHAHLENHKALGKISLVNTWS